MPVVVWLMLLARWLAVVGRFEKGWFVDYLVVELCMVNSCETISLAPRFALLAMLEV